MKFHEFDFNMDDDFSIEKSKRQIGEDMQTILQETPEAAPVLEEIAKLLAIAENPDEFIRTISFTIPEVGTYELIASPAAGQPDYSVMVKLTPANGGHPIGPAQISMHKTLKVAEERMNELATTYKVTRPTEFVDCVTKIRYNSEGYFTPYDATFPDLGPFASLLDILNIEGENE